MVLALAGPGVNEASTGLGRRPTMKTTWQVWLGAVLVVLLLLGGFAVWVWEPWNPLNPWNRQRIVPGMTRAQVEDILGKPSVVTDDHWLVYYHEEGNSIFVVTF